MISSYVILSFLISLEDVQFDLYIQRTANYQRNFFDTKLTKICNTNNHNIKLIQSPIPLFTEIDIDTLFCSRDERHY